MPAVEICPNLAESSAHQFLARCGEHRAVGDTAGQALDALNAMIPPIPTANGSTWIVIEQPYQPDAHFTEPQIRRLQDLQSESRRAEARGESLSEELRNELLALIDDELASSARRLASRFSSDGR